MPSRHGTKIIAVGATREIYAASWPAPEHDFARREAARVRPRGAPRTTQPASNFTGGWSQMRVDVTLRPSGSQISFSEAL